MNNLVECPNCSSKNLAFHSRVKDRHYGIEGTFNLDKCKECDLVFLNPMFNDEELSKFYPEDDYYAYHQTYDNVASKSPKTNVVLNEKTQEKILDIGCGNGWVLYEYKQKGWRVAGVEPSKVAAKIGNEQGLNIFNGTLLEAKYPDNEFDFVHSNHSFEHIYNPNEVLNEINRILKPNGKLLIGIPNVKGINSILAKDYWYYLGAPVHTFNYSPKNITQLLEKHNFRVQEIKHVSTTHGILGSIQIYLNRHTSKNSTEGYVVNKTIFKYIATYIARIENFLRIGDCIEVFATKNNQSI
jgi:SAM-dependent methyltransferase